MEHFAQKCTNFQNVQRKNFQPSKIFRQTKTMACVNAVVADTNEEARNCLQV
jgi:alkanesulfonate monooxygenase SsuD/methylene tetrahydromethanopterin reductase-like flavin-dependent oxidoreductase (luciferase family)